MLEIVLNEVNECGATGVWRVLLFLRFYMIVYKVTVSFHARCLYHWLKGDYDAWLDCLDAEDNKGADTQLPLSFQKSLKKTSILMFSLDGTTGFHLRTSYPLFSLPDDLCIM